MNQDSLEARVIQVETQLAHQQLLSDQLNEVLIEQGKQLMRMERIILRLENQLKELQHVSREPRGPADEKPPHY